MNSKITYTDEPMELGEVVEDFLPPPEELIPKINKVQITLKLSQETVDFFKVQAEKQKISYQKMISLLVDQYAQER